MDVQGEILTFTPESLPVRQGYVRAIFDIISMLEQEPENA